MIYQKSRMAEILITFSGVTGSDFILGCDKFKVPFSLGKMCDECWNQILRFDKNVKFWAKLY